METQVMSGESVAISRWMSESNQQLQQEISQYAKAQLNQESKDEINAGKSLRGGAEVERIIKEKIEEAKE